MKNALLFLFLVPACGAVDASSESITFRCPAFRYSISTGAVNLAFADVATGSNYLHGAGSACASVRIGGREQPATAASLKGDRLTLDFGSSGSRAVLRVEVPEEAAAGESAGRPLVFAVESVTGEEVDALVFLNVPLTLAGAPREPFGACALSLNLRTRVDALPALQTQLRASCEKKFGLTGAKVAVVAAPMQRMLPALQQALASANELPVCKTAGPWAREVPFSRGSYLFNFGSLTESNLVDWVSMVRTLGFSQIDNHGGGGFFRFGDMELNRQKWPDGWDSWKRIVARLHAEGIGSIFHTYAFFIDKRSKYVTPVPDPRLDAFRVFTLAKPVDTGATDVEVNEPTSAISAVTGFFEHNSVILHVGDELMMFSGASKHAPWRFTGVQRGALGTGAAPHDAGAKARHLKECFGLLVPDVESSLFEEIAANHATVVNHCGFDGIYLDAIDGSSILRGGDECWHWAGKFVTEIQKRLKQPVGMEMSAMWHHFWQYRTRWQAWDYPQRGHKRFIDLHAEAVNGGLLLPLHLGWWGFQSFSPPQVEPTYPDVMETLGARLIGLDAGISLTAGVDRESLRKTPLFARAAGILSRCEELRHSNAFSEEVKRQLREPGKEFALFRNSAGKDRFREVRPQAQVLALDEAWTLDWRITNSFGPQPLKFRLEALMAVEAPDAATNILVFDVAEARATEKGWPKSVADGVSLALPAAARQGQPGALTMLVATNSGKVPRHAAWARLEKKFSPPLNLKERQGISFDIEGDGSGALLAIRLESPQHLSFGAIADRYVVLDFVGRRRIALVETESSRWSDYVWNDGKGAYNVYRETIDFGAVETASVWLQNLPAGKEVRCGLGPIAAVPLAPVALKSPAVRLSGKTLKLPLELHPGEWVECRGKGACAVYRANGELRANVELEGEWAELEAGANPLQFSATVLEGRAPRGRLTVFCEGKALH